MSAAVNFDVFENVLTMTAAFSKKSQKYGSNEYKELTKLLRAHPTAEIVVLEPRTGKKGMTFKQMEAYITAVFPEDTALMNEFKTVKSIAAIRSALPYKEVKEWFEKRFPNVKAADLTFDKDGKLVTEGLIAAAAVKPVDNIMPMVAKSDEEEDVRKEA